MGLDDNPYQRPTTAAERASGGRARPGVSIRGVLIGLPVVFVFMLAGGILFGVIASLTMGLDSDALERQGGAVAFAQQIPYSHVVSILIWAVGVFCGGYVAAGYSRDRQIAQGFLVGAMICTFLLSIRFVAGGAHFSTGDLLLTSFAAVGALGGAIRGARMAATASAYR